MTINERVSPETLDKIIEAADEVIRALAGTNEDVHKNDSAKMCQLWDDLNDRYATPAIVKALAAEIKQYRAATEKPVACIDRANLDYFDSGAGADVWPASESDSDDVLLYAAPQLPQPAPVAVPDEMEMDDDFDSAFEHGKAVGWNACRAAMLTAAPAVQAEQLSGNTEPVIQSYTLREGLAAIRNLGPIDAEKIQAERDALNEPDVPDGYALVPVEPTSAILDEFDSIIDYGAEDSKDAWCRLLASAWVKSLPAAPKQDFREIPNSSTNNCRENAETSTKCWCHTCRPVTMTDMRFVVCPDCGNKRCPHANDHRNVCTGSNEPGQEGSAYPAAPKQEAE